MLESILFELTLMIMKRAGIEETKTVVTECPTQQRINELHNKYSVPGFRVYVTCDPYIETRCDRVAMAMSGVNKEACRDDW